MPAGNLITAGLTRETLASLEAATADKQASFLIVPPSTASSSASSRAGVCEALPQVWQDLFAAARSAQSDAVLDGLACRPPLPAPTGLRPAPAGSGGSAAPGSAGGNASPAADDPALGITRGTVFTHYLSPEALVRHHRLGKPEVRRLYQALQVYSLGFHQCMLELTAHASNRGLLLLSLWRGFAMLWDGALQTVFPAETVQQSRERQAALLLGEQLQEELVEERARGAALEQDKAALQQQMEGVVVQMLSAQADAAAVQQGTAELNRKLRAAQQERAALAAQAEAARRELLLLQEKMAALAGPQDSLYTRAQQLERALKEKQAQLSAAAKQAAEALARREEAQQAAREERLRREAAEARARQLQGDLNTATLQLRAAQSAAAAREQEAAAAAAARQEQDAAEAAAREGAAARDAQRAADAEVAAAALRTQLADAEAQLGEERGRNEELVGLLYPLTAKLKALEAAGGG